MYVCISSLVHSLWGWKDILWVWGVFASRPAINVANSFMVCRLKIALNTRTAQFACACFAGPFLNGHLGDTQCSRYPSTKCLTYPAPFLPLSLCEQWTILCFFFVNFILAQCVIKRMPPNTKTKSGKSGNRTSTERERVKWKTGGAGKGYIIAADRRTHFIRFGKIFKSEKRNWIFTTAAQKVFGIRGGRGERATQTWRRLHHSCRIPCKKCKGRTPYKLYIDACSVQTIQVVSVD